MIIAADPNRSSVEGILGIAPVFWGNGVRGGFSRGVALGQAGIEVRVVRLCVVGDSDQGCRIARDFRRVGHDQRNRLAAEVDFFVIERAQRRASGSGIVIVAAVEPGDVRPIEMRNDLHDAGHGQRGRSIYRAYAAFGDRTGEGEAVEQTVDRVLGGIAGLARHLRDAVDPVERVSDMNGGRHGVPPHATRLSACDCGVPSVAC